MRRVAVLAAACFMSCAGARIPRVPGDPPPQVQNAEEEREYQELLEYSTRSRAVYDQLDTKVFFQVTWQSPQFAAARVRREAQFKGMPQSEHAQQWLTEENRLADATEFLLAVHANDYRFDDFDKPQSMWRMVLVSQGEEILPVSVVRLGRTTTELRAYYSHLESFWVAYRVRFPHRDWSAGAGPSLKIASPLGQAEFSFSAR